jgi:curved DNA-binding protein
MDFKDYYAVMGVGRDASAEEIKRAYRKLARKYHPDVSKEADAEKRFKDLGEAYEVLKDPEKRAAYDQLGRGYHDGQAFRPPPDWDQGFQFSGGGFTDAGTRGFSDFFESLFGRGGFASASAGAGVRSNRGEDQHARIQIGLEDAFNGATLGVELSSTGYDTAGRPQGRQRKIQVKIPKGITSGKRIRLGGQGQPGHSGGPAGDLYLQVELRPHPLYEVDGKDVVLTLPLAPWEAALGARVEAPTLGGPVEMTVPPGSRSGQKLRLKGRGLGPDGDRGDQIVVLRLALPPADTPERQAYYREMAERMPFDPRSELGV